MAGARRGSGTRPPARGRPPTSSRSTATSARSASTCAATRAARSCAAWSPVGRPGRELPRRWRSTASGFGDAALAGLNPDLVHLAISGFGTDGPDAAKPGYDFVVQAVGGLMSITGATDEDGGRPTKVGVAISDVVSGLFGAVSVLAGLVARAVPARTGEPGGGEGQRIDVSLLESTLAVLVNQAQNAFVGGERPVRMGNAHPNLVPYEAFRDGRRRARRWRSAASGSGRGCARRSGCPGWPQDPRYATNGDRVDHRAELRPDPGVAVREPLDGRVDRRSLDARRHPVRPDQRRRRGVRRRRRRWPAGWRSTSSTRCWAPSARSGCRSGCPRRPASIRSAPPLLGEHAAEILAELGYGTGRRRRRSAQHRRDLTCPRGR